MSTVPDVPTDRLTSVYVHFPWCAKKCPYCDFATRATEPTAIPHERYADAILRELERRGGSLEGRRLASVFFGGGTPSLWDPDALGRVLAAIKGAFPTHAGSVEVTAECNPSSLDRARAAGLRKAGVDRLSIGVQSLVNDQLRYLGRLHDAEGARAALRAAAHEVDRVSADLIFGMPGQRPEQLAAELEQLVELGVEHLSAYALTIEPATLFGELHRRGRLRVASDDQYASLFLAAEATLDRHGFSHYEVSNYARPGAESVHNAHYWKGGDYLGLGAAAVGCLTTAPGQAYRFRNESDPARYLANPGQEEERERLGPSELIREALMLGLRTRDGLHLERARARAGEDPLARRAAAVERRVAQGDLVHEPPLLRIPQDRWLSLDSIVLDLF